jgi:hypothetical protein
LGIFSRIKFTEDDLIRAFQTLKTARLIKRISIFTADLDPDISPAQRINIWNMGNLPRNTYNFVYEIIYRRT